MVGWFSLTLGSALSAGLATWVSNGGYTSLYYQPGQYGLVWALLELPLVFVATDYITYWLHRSCLCQVFFVGFANHHPIHWHQTNQWTK